jgi:AMP deaminase
MSETVETKPKAEYVRIQVSNQDSLVEPEIYFSAKKIQKALQLRSSYFTHFSNPLSIDENDPFKIQYTKSSDYSIRLSNGIYSAVQSGKSNSKIPTLDEYKKDVSDLFILSGDPALKSFCYKRITFLKYMFSFHLTLNSHAEGQVLKTKCKKDFYHVEKVDQHVSIDSIFSAKTLLKFIMDKYTSSPLDIVEKDENGKDMTLEALLKRMSPNPETITIDFLDVMTEGMLHRQDKFERSLEKIGGGKKLKKVFLSIENRQSGLYFAQLSNQINSDNSGGFSSNEISIRLFGKNMLDWNTTANWIVKHKIYSKHSRYIITVSREFSHYCKSGLCKTFEQYMSMIFKPIFAVTLDPSENPNLATFLQLCTGFGFQCIENTFDAPPQPSEWKIASEWKEGEPDFEYYLYHLWANVKQLNELRTSRGLNPLLFKPHCGESVRMHLASAYLFADCIHNGLQLRFTPFLCYLFYLQQVGISYTPLHTNKINMEYKENPFPELFQMGQNVTLATNNPLHSHYTEEHLLEEYSVASQIWGFSRCDLCEISNNSVRQSGYERNIKENWIGKDYDKGNDQIHSNVPNIRFSYRKDTLNRELEFVEFCGKKKL